MTIVSDLPGFDYPPFLIPQRDGTSFALWEEVVYTGSEGDSWTIPEGFKTDFATIPAAVSWAVPKMGAYTLAAIVHDLLCEGLNDWHALTRTDGRTVDTPTATSADADALFAKIARDYGVNRVTAALLWTGVRWGALANPARRAGWLRTAPKVLALSLAFAPVLLPASVLAVAGQVVLRVVGWVTR